jgi:uncharacterized membrane-anchored protein
MLKTMLWMGLGACCASSVAGVDIIVYSRLDWAMVVPLLLLAWGCSIVCYITYRVIAQEKAEDARKIILGQAAFAFTALIVCFVAMFIVFVLPFSILIRIWCHVVIAGDSIFEIEHL